MYEIIKTLEIAGEHHLDLPYESKCKNCHGHNWWITIHAECEDDKLEHDMVIDFKHIKEQISDKLDHQNLNEVLDFNPTAENIAKWVADTVNLMRSGVNCYRVEVEESKNNTAIWRSR